MNASIIFQGGMLELRHADAIEHVPAPFRFVQGRWCCEAHHYPLALPWLQQQGIQDSVPRWQRLALDLHETRELHSYQLEALAAWKQAGGRGRLVLPIRVAKTLLAVYAIHAIGSSTLIVVPTVQSLSQWYYHLTHAFRTEIGVYFRDEKRVRLLTVAIHDAARDLIAEHGRA